MSPCPFPTTITITSQAPPMKAVYDKSRKWVIFSNQDWVYQIIFICGHGDPLLGYHLKKEGWNSSPTWEFLCYLGPEVCNLFVERLLLHSFNQIFFNWFPVLCLLFYALVFIYKSEGSSISHFSKFWEPIKGNHWLLNIFYWLVSQCVIENILHMTLIIQTHTIQTTSWPLLYFDQPSRLKYPVIKPCWNFS